jgi:small-conductance mechanosensitive channel
VSLPSQILEETVRRFSEKLAVAIPNLLAGLVFLALALVGIKIVLRIARASLHRLYPAEQRLIADLVVTVLSVLLWFAVALGFLNIVGFGEIAASLGTATGFIALGVSYALSEMIEDTVAGVYLLRDPDFNVGDRVETGAGTGRVVAIELRKSRIETDDGNRVVVANRSIESKWTHDVTSGK